MLQFFFFSLYIKSKFDHNRGQWQIIVEEIIVISIIAKNLISRASSMCYSYFIAVTTFS